MPSRHISKTCFRLSNAIVLICLFSAACPSGTAVYGYSQEKINAVRHAKENVKISAQLNNKVLEQMEKC